MKKKIVIKLSGRVFGIDNVKMLKDYASFLVKISKVCQPIVIAGGGNIARHYISHARSSGADESTLDELGIFPALFHLRVRSSLFSRKGSLDFL